MASVETSAVDSDFELVNKLRTLFTVARNHRRSMYDNWRRNYRLVNNRVTIGAKESWAPNPRDSEIYPNLSALVAWMTDQNTNIDVTAATDPNSDYYSFWSAVATDLATVMQTNWFVERYSDQVKMACWDALIYGAGFFKSVWDQGKAGGLGNAMLKRVDPWSLYLDPTATCLEECEYIVEVHSMSLAELDRRWPGSSSLVEASSSLTGEGIEQRPTPFDETSRIPKANPGALPMGNGRWGAPTTKGPSEIILPAITVYEFWLRENDEWWDSELADAPRGLTIAPGEKPTDADDKDQKHVTERWRVVVMAANQILMDEWADDLMTAATHPYDRFPFEENGEMFGISLVDHLAQPQLALNRILTALQQNAELIGNPIFLEPTNAGLDRVNIINRPGQRLRLQGAAAMSTNRPDWLSPPEMPNFVQQLVEFWIGRIENISGLSASVKGGTDSRTPEGVVSTVQEAAFVRIRAALANLESCLSSASYKLADLIIDNYTEPRVIAVTGPEGSKTSLALAARHFTVPTHKGATPLQYTLLLQAGASMPTSRQARVAEADQAYALGIIDRQAWMEAHSFPHWQKVLERVNQQIAQGTFQPPGARQRAGH